MSIKAKSFNFILSQIKLAHDEIEPSDNRANKITDAAVWTYFVPEIRDRAAVCSRFRSSKEPSELVKSIAGATTPGREESPYQRTAYLLEGLLKDKSSPIFKTLIDDLTISYYFDTDAIDMYMSYLHQDFGDAPAYLFKEFEEAVTMLLLWTAFLKNHERPEVIQARIDCIEMLLLASLYGPRDYRPELYMRMASKDDVTRPVQRSAVDLVNPKDRRIEQSPYLTRVTFSHNPPDECDWIVCQLSQDDAVNSSGRFISYPLEEKVDVYIARGFDRFEEKDSSLYIPVDCELASRNNHLRISLENNSWVVRDLDSTNGTLVVRRNGDRFPLYNKAEIPVESVMLQNGDVICIAPRWDTMHADPNCPAFVFHTATVDWI